VPGLKPWGVLAFGFTRERFMKIIPFVYHIAVLPERR